jgi:hypothetical protein
MRNTKIFITILVGIIALLVWIRFGYLPKSPDVELPGTSVVIVSPSPTPEPWQSFATDDFTLDYPKEASASAVDGGPDSIAWRINYMGEAQKASGRTQTELFDGYAVNIDRFQVASDSAALVQAELDRAQSQDLCGEEDIAAMTTTTFAGEPAHTYTSSCLGESTQLYQQRGEYLYRISTMVAGEAEQLVIYKDILTRILGSFSYLP